MGATGEMEVSAVLQRRGISRTLALKMKGERITGEPGGITRREATNK
jgi:hypothetical protein